MSSGTLPALLAGVEPAEHDVRRWWTLAAAALLLRFVIMPYGGFPVDIGTFKAWADMLMRDGPAAFYGGGFADYLPGYLYVLWAIAEIHHVVRFSDQAYLFALKLPAAIADTVTAWLIFTGARRLGSRPALALSASYLFNPGIIFTGAYWGQADAVGAVFAVAAAATLGRRPPALTAVLMTAAVLIKPQTAPAAIPIGLVLLRTLTRPDAGPPRWDLVLGAGAASAATLLAVILPFRLSPLGLAGVLRTSLDVYPFSSVVAFNFWGATMRFWVGDEVRWLGIPHYAIGGAAALAALTAVAVWAWRHPAPRGVILAAAVGLLAAFVLPTRIHERYLLPAIPFAALAAAADRRMVWTYAGLSLVFLLNLVYAYTRPYVHTFLLPGWLEHTVFSEPMTRVWSAMAVVMLLIAFRALLRPGAGIDHPKTPEVSAVEPAVS